jgi:G3E family GTPase
MLQARILPIAQEHGAMTAVSEPKPLTILGGYLGAGKTTLLNHLLRQAAGRRIAVIVNDFGEINIDADLIENRTADTLSIAGGCVCCSFGDDLIETLQSLCDRPEALDHIVIETSGVTLPRPLRASLSLLPGLRVVGTVILADAQAVRQQATDRHVGDTVRQQLQAADLLLISKIDQVPTDALAELRSWVGTQTGAPIIPVLHGEVPLEIVLGEFERWPGQADVALSGRREQARLLGVPQSLQAPTHLGSQYQTRTFEIPHALDPQILVHGLGALSPALLRAKGFIRDSHQQLWTVQCVGTRASLSPAPAQVGGPGRLVTISAGDEPDAETIRRLIEAASPPVPGDPTA